MRTAVASAFLSFHAERTPVVNLVIVGSVALDSVKTPFGAVENALGGAASYSSYAASFFTPVGIVAAVGTDFPSSYLDLLKKRISTEGLTVREGKTFRWDGYYEYDMNHAHTVKTELNVFAGFVPELPETYRKAGFVFLANIDPALQRSVLEQMDKPRLAVLDTMNYWIANKKQELMKTIADVDVLLLNETEARQLFETANLVSAGKKALELGLIACAIKKGEHGVLLFTDGNIFSVPGYPLEIVRDPTGAGDAFAGGFTGYLAKTGDLSEKNMRKAVVYGQALASFNVEDFSLNRLLDINIQDIEQRYGEFRDLIHF